MGSKDEAGFIEALQELEPCVQNYAWGVMGSSPSLVAKMAGGVPDPSKPYAELWMGTHPSASSKVQGEDLSAFLRRNPSFAGDKVSSAEWDFKLPFLFKCLSVRCPLSIQAHPNKELAKTLHKRDPKNYKDDNHKPELACAVTEFEGLCGFRPLNEIAMHLAQVPELLELVGQEAAEGVKSAVGVAAEHQSKMLRAAYAKLMSQPEDKVAEEAEKLVARLEAKVKSGEELSVCEQVVLSSNEEFPGDVGLMSIYLLNHVVLKPGESIFLKPNLPHAYLKGDCMEIMASSDNVVRAGFTPKFKDVDTLVEMLDYSPAFPMLITGNTYTDSKVSCYAPPGTVFPEFALGRCVLSGAGENASFGTSTSPRIVICISGSSAKLSATALGSGEVVKACSVEVSAGQVLICSAGVELTALCCKEGTECTVFVASCHPCAEAN